MNKTIRPLRSTIMILLCVAGFLRAIRAEVPWCSAAIAQERDAPIYPPIAKAANVSGTVIGRLSLSEHGDFTGFEFVSGPEMLRYAVRSAVEKWKFQPQSAAGACEVLVIVDFTIDQDANPNSTKPPTNGIRIWVNALRPTLNTNNKAGE